MCADVESEWTALLVGFLLAGAGAGLVNPTLAERVKINLAGRGQLCLGGVCAAPIQQSPESTPSSPRRLRRGITVAPSL